MGPGLSLNEETQQLVRVLAKEINKPLLLDGDGITAIAKETGLLKRRKAPTVLTPHVGEMSRITGKERQDIEKDRIGVLQETATKLHAYLVLKGPHSLIGCPDGRVIINVSGATDGKAGMATAGSGDVLNGTIAAMYCLGLKMEEAVQTGVFIHGLSGDLAAKARGPDGMTAKDILNTLPNAVKYYRQNLGSIAADFYDTIHLV
jgi:NAD(P)H-hydrate epimerase